MATPEVLRKILPPRAIKQLAEQQRKLGSLIPASQRISGGGGTPTVANEELLSRQAEAKAVKQKQDASIFRERGRLIGEALAQLTRDVRVAKDRNEIFKLRKDFRKFAQTGAKQQATDFITKKVSAPEVSVKTQRPLDVQIAPTFKEQFQQAIKSSTPEFGDSQVANIIESGLGKIGGTVTFATEKTIGKLSALEDNKGQKRFSDIQIRNFVELAKEVGTEIIIGKGVGKVVTLGRGAFSKLLPKTIKESSKIKKFKKVVDVALVGGLGTVEAIRLNNVLKNQGEDKFILELIGTASFLKGFGSTGLKSSAQSEKEFEAFANALKVSPPTGKGLFVGQPNFALLSRTRKKGVFDKFGKLGESKIKSIESGRLKEIQTGRGLPSLEEAETLSSLVELKIANEKTLAGQLKILADLKSKSKGSLGKKNFEAFLKSLTDKQILKLPKIDIGKGGTIKTGISPSKIRNEIRITRARTIGDLNKKVVEEKNKLRKLIFQRAPVEVIDFQRISIDNAIEDLSKLRTNIASKSGQELRSQTRQATQTKQITNQQTIQQQRAISKQRLLRLLKPATAQRQLQLQRTRLRLKQVTKQKFGIPKPFFPPPFTSAGGFKKVKKKPVKSVKGRFDLFVRKKGKDIFVKTFRSKPKARTQLRKRLSNSLRASGFIFDKLKKQRIKPKVKPGFRLSKVEPRRLVEKRNKRLDSKLETTSIQQAKRRKPKVLKLKSVSMFKKISKKKR